MRQVEVERDGGMITLWLDQPDRRNPLSRAAMAELDAELAAAYVDPRCRAVVLAGRGPAFSAGLDLREAETGDMLPATRALIALQRRILTAPVPVVARVHGAARAGALGLLAAADLVVAADHVTFAFPEVRLGVAPAVVSATLLPRLQQRAAAELMLTGRSFSAAEAALVGLVTRAVDASALDGTIRRLCADLAAGDAAALAETKGLLTRSIVEDLDRRGDELARRSADLFAQRRARPTRAPARPTSQKE